MSAMLADVHAIEQQRDQVELIERGRLPGLELRARPRDEPAANGALARPSTRHLGGQRLQAARILARRHSDQHLFDDAAIERIGRGDRLKRRQRDFAGGRPRPWALKHHLPSTQDDFARGPPRTAGRALGLVRIPRAANGGAILLEHDSDGAQTRPNDQLHQLGFRVDQQIDERQVTYR